MRDIVERLRDGMWGMQERRQAADEIERLRRYAEGHDEAIILLRCKIERLRAELRRIADGNQHTRNFLLWRKAFPLKNAEGKGK